MSPKNEKDAREFWNRRAATFPRYDPREESYEAGILRRMKDMGVVFANKRILDVGCGCGQFTIRLAMMGKWVTGLDVSENMLGILREDAERYALKNIDSVRSDWLDFVPGTDYDMVFCTMTPALHSRQGKERLLEYGGAQVVYMDFQQRVRSGMLQGFYSLYNQEPHASNSALYMKDWLDERKIDYKRETVEGAWEKNMDLEEAVNLCMATGYDFTTRPTEKEVRAYLEPLVDKTGVIPNRTNYVVDIFVWQNF